MGLMAGPLSPPKTLASLGRRVSTSTAMASRVLISEIPSAPPSSAARAISAMSVTFGESLAMSGPAARGFGRARRGPGRLGDEGRAERRSS